MLGIRPYNPNDAETIVSWVRDEMSYQFWSAGRITGGYPITADQLNAHYKKEQENPDYWAMTAIDEAGMPIGHFIMRITDQSRQTLRLGFIILDHKIRGKGYGRQMVRAAIDFGFQIPGIKKVTLGVFKENPSALSCYRSIGFQPINQVEYLQGGQIYQCIEMELNSEKRSLTLSM